MGLRKYLINKPTREYIIAYLQPPFGGLEQICLRFAKCLIKMPYGRFSSWNYFLFVDVVEVHHDEMKG